MSRTEYHVVPNPNGGWDVKKGGGKRASGHFDTKAKAFKIGRALAIEYNAELVVHKLDGTIQNPNTYSDIDPFPPEDKVH